MLRYDVQCGCPFNDLRDGDEVTERLCLPQLHLCSVRGSFPPCEGIGIADLNGLKNSCPLSATSICLESSRCSQVTPAYFSSKDATRTLRLPLGVTFSTFDSVGGLKLVGPMSHDQPTAGHSWSSVQICSDITHPSSHFKHPFKPWSKHPRGNHLKGTSQGPPCLAFLCLRAFRIRGLGLCLYTHLP